AGLEFIALNMESAQYMERVRLSEGKDLEAVEKALEVAARRDTLLEDSPPFAIDVGHFQARIASAHSTNVRRMGDHLGPPREEFLTAMASSLASSIRNLATASHWQEIFHDTFERQHTGEDWQIVSGNWSV